MTLAGLALLTAAGCSSSPVAAGNRPGCSWPRQTAPERSAIALDFSGDRLLAFDTANGGLVGDCAASEAGGLTTPTVRFTAAGTKVITRGRQYVMPPVAGPVITAMPDNTSIGGPSGGSEQNQGGVRDLHTGVHHDLTFPGWLVASVVGQRLVLFRYAEYTAPGTNPDDWCVLPDRTAGEARCAPVPGATGPGTPYVTPAGRIGWSPLAGRPLRIGPVAGYAAVVGRAGISGWSPPDGTGGIVSPDLRTVFLPDGLPSAPGRLAWADVRVNDGRLTSTLHTSRFAGDHRYTLAEIQTAACGWFGGPDGTLMLVQCDGQVDRFDSSPRRHPVVRLRAPKDVALGYVFTLPAGDRTAT